MTLVIILFFLFMIMGMPVAFAIGISGFVFFLQQPTLKLTMPVQIILSQTQSFVLLAIPMFIFAGNLLNETGITHRLMKLASVLAGHLRAGLAQVNLVLATMLGGITSSAIGDASMLGRVLGPGMIERGYSRGFSAGASDSSCTEASAKCPSDGCLPRGSCRDSS